ncbi:hypothetical protein KBB05_03280, partial [Patescibacteria group bacterium]|nr:hypothetical protein [Patescibacteria group bacterium]
FIYTFIIVSQANTYLKQITRTKGARYYLEEKDCYKYLLPPFVKFLSEIFGLSSKKHKKNLMGMRVL